MNIEKVKIGDKEVMPFTIPSGIVMTDPNCAARLLNRIPELGIWTTKSIGLRERVMPTEALTKNNPEELEFGCREPLFVQLEGGTYANAVRLINEGAVKTRVKIEAANIPKDRVVLASVFASEASELVKIIDTLDPVADAFEWNGGCPHGGKVGMSQGQDPEMVYSFMKAITERTNKPAIFKAPWNVSPESIRAAVKAGAYGIAGINTVPVEPLDSEGQHLLWNKRGGMSGKGVKEIGLKKVREIREAAGNLLMILTGGISNANDVEEYAEHARGGPIAFGVGTATVGMNEIELATYFSTLYSDCKNGTNLAERLLKKVDMQYRKVRIKEIIRAACDYPIIQTDSQINALQGQFVFERIPGVGEKPFSIMDDDPLTLGVLERGEFTKSLTSLKAGDSFYVRGPHGVGVEVSKKSNVVLVGGGCGIAGLYLLAKRLSKDSDVLTLLAAKDREHLAYVEEFRKHGEVRIATEDGSLGTRGRVTDLLSNLRENSYFFNCGPRAMVEAVLPIELLRSSPERVFSSLDYMTRCGVGICGSCTDKHGKRTCVEGPFMNS